MADREPGHVAGEEPESYGRVVAGLCGLLAGLALLGVGSLRNHETKPTPAPLVSATEPEAKPEATVDIPPPPPAPAPARKPRKPRPAPPALDTEAVARAEADLDAAARDRARAEGRADDAARRLADAAEHAAQEARLSKNLAFRVRDPSTRIAQASARGGFLKAENAKLKSELDTLARAPRPKSKSLANKNPVARASDGDEFHFEVRRGRIAFIDLDRLIAMVKSDAQQRIRYTDGARVIENRVGPVGSFSLRYILGRSVAAGLDDVLDRRGSLSYDLRGWEVVPTFEGRGETYESASRPFSEFTHAIGRLNPERSTVTMWVYPDGFALYRRLRDELHARGFTVAARPLPDNMTIRGSPSGSVSAGQ